MLRTSDDTADEIASRSRNMNRGRPIPAEMYSLAKTQVLQYLASHPNITNRTLRTISPIGYDEAIYVLGKLCDEGVLERRGNAGATHYVLVRGS
jgi:predicted HTH transcriptional regulator